MYEVILKNGKSYNASYVDESYRKGQYTFSMTVTDDGTKSLEDYAAEMDADAVSEITVADESGNVKILTGYSEVLVSRKFDDDVLLVRITKE